MKMMNGIGASLTPGVTTLVTGLQLGFTLLPAAQPPAFLAAHPAHTFTVLL